MTNKRVVLCGVPGMDKNDIITMEKYIKEEYGNNVDFDFISESTLPDEELIEKAKGAEVLISWDQEMNDDLYKELNLRSYTAASIGFNAANVESATRNNTLVTNVADYCMDEVATHTLALMLGLYRKMYHMLPYVKDGNWDLSPMGSIKRFEDSTVGLLGFGSIPRKVAEKLKGFNLNILSYDPFVDSEEMKKYGVEKVELDQLFTDSDYLSLHTPLLDSTAEVVNKDTLNMMKDTAYIINTARGGLINQEDLYDALKNNIIQGAGLDVFTVEPPGEIEKKIIDLDNTIVTAHCAYCSNEASDLQLRTTAKIVADILNSKVPINVRNPEVIDNLSWVKEKGE